MKNIKAFFFKYHRLIGLILAVPVLITVFSGMGIFAADEIFHNEKLAEFFTGIHTMKILGIEDIYIPFVGIGLIWLVASGLIASGIFKKKKK